MFKTRIAHGMLSAGFISTVIGTKLPGPGCIYVSQTLRFLAPVRVGETFNDEKSVIAIKALYATGFFKDVRLEVNGDVLVVESNAPPRPDDGKGIKGFVMKKVMAKAGAAVVLASRRTDRLMALRAQIKRLA